MLRRYPTQLDIACASKESGGARNSVWHYHYHSIGHRVGDYVNSRAGDARRQLDFGRLDRTAVRAPDALLPGVSHKHATRTCTLEGLSLSSYVVR